mmetsp:Transcript_3827/g.12117  ORF Transcript_3827/g.12117 Transcript_3827/m.12117 type:complete len:376 (-) Transcript_3827:1779-2906(-)
MLRRRARSALHARDAAPVRDQPAGPRQRREADGEARRGCQDADLPRRRRGRHRRRGARAAARRLRHRARRRRRAQDHHHLQLVPVRRQLPPRRHRDAQRRRVGGPAAQLHPREDRHPARALARQRRRVRRAAVPRHVRVQGVRREPRQPGGGPPHRAVARRHPPPPALHRHRRRRPPDLEGDRYPLRVPAQVAPLAADVRRRAQRPPCAARHAAGHGDRELHLRRRERRAHAARVRPGRRHAPHGADPRPRAARQHGALPRRLPLLVPARERRAQGAVAPGPGQGRRGPEARRDHRQAALRHLPAPRDDPRWRARRSAAHVRAHAHRQAHLAGDAPHRQGQARALAPHGAHAVGVGQVPRDAPHDVARAPAGRRR